MNEELIAAAKKLYEELKKKNIKISTAESCTGGLVASTLTSVPGISSYFEYGFVTYSNEAKKKLLSIDEDTLEKHTAVSTEVAAEMAQGALSKSGADIAVAVTGNAGPGTSEGKPLGMIFISLASKEGYTLLKELKLNGDRCANRIKAAKELIEMAREYVSEL